MKGMQAMVGEDNMDAATDLAASEIEVLQCLRGLLDETKGEKDPGVRFRQVLTKAKTRFGGTAYTDPDMVNLYNYAIRVPTPLLDNLCQVHFAVIPAALLRVRPVDFGHVANVGSTHPYIKVSIIISLYLGAIQSGGGTLRRQSGGVAAFATGLKKDAVTKLAQDQETRDSAETFLKELLRHYVVDPKAVLTKALLHCRARFFHRVGKLLLQGWPSTAHATRTALAKIEAAYAQDLLECGAFSTGVRPQVLHAEPELVTTAGAEEKKAQGKRRRRSPCKSFQRGCGRSLRTLKPPTWSRRRGTRRTAGRRREEKTQVQGEEKSDCRAKPRRRHRSRAP